MASFVCLRCSRAFFENWYFFKPLRRSCAYCSLTRGGESHAITGGNRLLAVALVHRVVSKYSNEV